MITPTFNPLAFESQFQADFRACKTGDDILELVKQTLNAELFKTQGGSFFSLENFILKHLQQWYMEDFEDGADTSNPANESEEQTSLKLFYCKVLHHFCSVTDYECGSAAYIVASMPGTPVLYLAQCTSVEEKIKALAHTGTIFLFQELIKGRYSEVGKELGIDQLIQATVSYIPNFKYNIEFMSADDFGGFGALLQSVVSYLANNTPDENTLLAAGYMLNLAGLKTGDSNATDDERYVFNDYLKEQLLNALRKHTDVNKILNLLSCSELLDDEKVIPFERWKFLLSDNISDTVDYNLNV